MKRAYLAEVIKKHGRRIKKYGDQLPGSFETEMIHELRIEYKKLRAFIRLLKMDSRTRHHIMSPDFKTLYAAAGQVRDLQLFLPSVIARSEKDNTPLPVYVQHLQQRLFKAKEALVEAVEKLRAGKALDHITHALPASLNDAAIRKFIHHKVAAVQVILLALEKDKELHTIRKQLKDIIYNIRIFDSDWGISFPVTAWRSEKRLQDTAAMLGDFNDRCIALSFLSEEIIDTLPEAEKDVLQAWRLEMGEEKEMFKQQMIGQLSQLHLVSNFERIS
ncbi:CHAD domain-containing protein [Pseudoflavitalea sp. X16]|uniref:CHAD domain-containing protein n=1 Tax=Paraflavitalea devenefica TaxID=2716334 RepID=UPI0014222F0E|nr:CHAD domain-containing protein [Paraflavitalea devenefica]NII25053.1 CHAD domain-containing protein [Paraflavitalea devenefica]